MLDVAVVGGGPVGLTLALLLGRLGVTCEVLERDERPPSMPRAVHLDDEALRTLEMAGVAGDFAVRPVDGMSLVDRDLRSFVTIDRTRGRFGWPASALMHQPDLERALRARAGPLLRRGARVTGLTPGSTMVSLDLEGGERVGCRWVVGCDGTGSTVRRLAGIGMQEFGFRQRWLVVDLHGADAGAHPQRVLQICDPARPGTSVPVGGRRHRFELRVRPGEPEDDLVARAAELAAPYGRRLGISAGEVERAAVYEFRGRLARTLRRGRVLLAGDAAHEMPPFLGQGLCTGLRDAANLAWKLAYVAHGRADPRLLDTYADERAPHARHAIRLTAAVGRVVSDRRPVRAAVRNRVLAAGERVLSAGRVGAIEVPRLPDGPLVDGGGLPSEHVVGVPEGRFTVLGRGVRARAGLPPALAGWWDALGAVFVDVDDAAGDARRCRDLVVVRPDGMVLGRYDHPSAGTLSPLADVAVRLSDAGLRAVP